MKLSVIIPVHNAEKYINATLDSVLQQKFEDPEDLEIICVDDASTDSSVSLIKKRIEKDSRIRLFINETNQYAGACRNKGLEEAKGEYVHFLDADDLVEEGAYQKYYDLAKVYDSDMVKGCSNCFDDESGMIFTTPSFSLEKVTQDYFERPLNFHQAPRVFSYVSVVPWNAIYKRSFLMEKGLRFNHLICVNDRSFYSEVVFTAENILLTHEHLVRYRTNNGESLVGNRAKNFHCQIDSWQIIMEQCKKYNITGPELAIVMERELIDIFIWYRKYKNLPENPQISEEVIAQTKAFARSLDITPLEAFPPAYKWYYDYLTLMPEFETLTKNYNSINKFKKRAQELMPECENMAEFLEKIQQVPETASAKQKKPETFFQKVLRHLKNYK